MAFIFCVRLVLVSILLSATIGHVKSAPPQQHQQQQQLSSNLTGKSNEKTADLTLLINETLKINNKLAPENVLSNQSFRDDWTFDRVEYDLMDFLQELNARYRYSNKSSSGESSQQSELAPSNINLEGKQGLVVSGVAQNASSVEQTKVSPTSSAVKTADATAASNVLHQVNTSLPAAVDRENATATPNVISEVTTSSSVLPISLATGDHDISESSWQYGIFDRFTRPRGSGTTPQPADTLAVSGSALDVRSFNGAECGLRSYRQEPDFFPDSSQLDTDEIAKELSQRRQRPPLGSSFFQSHKKYHHTATGDSSSALAHDHDLTGDELLENRDKLLPPPFDRYGEPTGVAGSSSGGSASGLAGPNHDDDNAPFHRRSNYSSIVEGINNQAESHFPSASPDSLTLQGGSADSEFNLSSRRQWLQQQLGSTLQMLGFNSTNQAALDYFINQTTGHSAAMGGRENMMKMSAGNKLAKSLIGHGHHHYEQATDIDPSSLSGPKVTEQELKARQDELKLEARVIGGNDAKLGDSPWSVSLQALVSRPGTGGLEYRHYCGGTIISEFYILTAAHCLDFMVGRESRLFVVVGDLNWRMSTASLHGRRFGIERLIIHGGYKSTAFGHDIGLIRTKESMKPLKVNGRYIINSVCLPERNVEHSGEAELVGWGLFSNRNEMADSLQIADVPILPRPLCVDLYRRRTGLIQWLIGIELITEKQVCAGTFGRGICQGDSGSALVVNEKVQVEGKAATNTRLKANMIRDTQQKATIIGIVAFGGIRRCSYQSLPGVYMQTSKYLDWILPRIQQG